MVPLRSSSAKEKGSPACTASARPGGHAFCSIMLSEVCSLCPGVSAGLFGSSRCTPTSLSEEGPYAAGICPRNDGSIVYHTRHFTGVSGILSNHSCITVPTTLHNHHK